jgi:hypothetical protein
MRHPAIALSFAVLALPFLAAPSGASNSQAKIVLHLTSPTTKNQCFDAPSLPTCDELVTGGQLYPAAYFAYVLVADADRNKGLAGLQFGIEYDGALHSGVDILGWTLCATLNFSYPGWPADGTGNLVTWDRINVCQRTEPGGFGTGVVANAGYFYVAAYSPDELQIVPRQVDGLAKVADCEAFEYIIPASALGLASFSDGGTAPGFNPCGSTPLPLACSISGAGNVPRQSVGHQYTVISNQPGTTFTWSITGQGSISGSTTGSSVLVNAGNPGTFRLMVTAVNGPNGSLCQFDVTVSSTPACTVSGPNQVLQGTGGHSYSVTSSSPGATFDWTITGDGSLSSPPSGSSVTVTAGSAGSFTLAVAVTADGFTGNCEKIVTVAGEANCVISGPGNVIEGTAGNIYTASTVPPATSFFWTITGDGIISGPLTGSSVNVSAGGPGSFTLSLAFSADGLDAVCQKVVVVTESASPTCAISGLGDVIEGMANIQYQGSSSYSSVSYLWSITGNGTITTSNTTSFIRVTAGAVGQFVLRLVTSAPGVSDTCEKTVIVSPTPTSQPGLNNNAKVMIHLLGPTTKNFCGRTAAYPECNAVITEGQLYPQLYYAYVVLNDGYTNGGLHSGIGGLEFGIAYDNGLQSGVDIYDWNLCADGEFPGTTWPASGSGNRVTWNPDRCQRYEPGGLGTGVVLTPGYFYMGAYTPDVLAVIPPPVGPVQATDCQGYPSAIEGAGVQHFPSHLGQAGFGGAPGYNPCALLVPVQPATWSRIKALFRDEE